MAASRHDALDLGLRQAVVAGPEEGSGAALAAGLARLGVDTCVLTYTDPTFATRLFSPRPGMVIVDATTPAAMHAAHATLEPLLEELRGLAVPVLAAAGAVSLPPADLLTLVDDIILPPHQAEEALLRAALVARRRGLAGAHLLSAGPLTIDVEGFRAWLAGRPLSLTYTEFQLARLLLLNRGKVLTREMLLTKIWGYNYLGGLRTVDVHIRRLRAKLAAEAPALIETVRNVGYRIAE